MPARYTLRREELSQTAAVHSTCLPGIRSAAEIGESSATHSGNWMVGLKMVNWPLSAALGR
jgi:hypothetical protein